MDDFEEFRARSYSGGFIEPLNRPRLLLDRRRVSLNAELATHRVSFSHPITTTTATHPEGAAATPVSSECTGLSLLFTRKFGSKKYRRRFSGYNEDTYRRIGEAEPPPGMGEKKAACCRSWDDDDEDGGNATQMRPRVSSAPTGCHRSRRMTDAVARDSVSPSRFQKVRSFSLTQKGIVCKGYTYVRGDSPEVHAPPAAERSTSGNRNYSSRDVHLNGPQQNNAPPEVLRKSRTRDRRHDMCRHFRVQVMGGSGTGKSSILAHFVRPECNLHSNASDDSPDASPVDGCQSSIVCTALDGQLYEMDITEMTVRTPVQNDFLVNGLTDVDGWLVVYSVEDRRSFELAIDCLYEIRTRLRIAGTVVTLAANKSDLVRTRMISEQEGRSASKTYGSRYIEVSATIGLNIDQLLIGTLNQMCLLKRSGSASTASTTASSSSSASSSSAAAGPHQVQDDASASAADPSRKGSVLASLGLRLLPCFDPTSCVCLLCARRSAIVSLLRQ